MFVSDQDFLRFKQQNAQTPILVIYYKNDPWFNYDNCKDFAKTRNNVRVVELAENTHETSSNQIVRNEVAEFFSKHKY